MNNEINDLFENEALRKEFEMRNLDLEQVFSPSPHDLQLENRQLKNLLDWVQKYTVCQSRKIMEADGYEYPPISFCISPENDWYIFERWINGLSVNTSIEEQLPQNYTIKKPEELSDDEILVELENILEAFEKTGSGLSLNEGIPERLVYIYLIESIGEKHSMCLEGGWVLDGCTGCCPDCFQRPWCSSGGNLCWNEDKEAGKMYLCDSLSPYVSASPVSLQLLLQAEAEEKRKLNEYKADKGDNDFSFDPSTNDFSDDDIEDDESGDTDIDDDDIPY